RLFAKRPVKDYRGANQRQVAEGLRKVAQRLARRPDLLGVQAQVVGVGEHLLEDVASLVEPTGTGQGIHIPERADGEGPLRARRPSAAGRPRSRASRTAPSSATQDMTRP